MLDDSSNYRHTTLRNGTPVTLRPLAPKDEPAMVEFYESVPPEDYRFYCPQGMTSERAMARVSTASDPHMVYLLIECADGRIGGYAWYAWERDDSPASVFGICIRRECQGVGAGELLMTQLLCKASSYGPPMMSLTVQLANPRAVALYKKMGFSVVREQIREYDGEPEYYMERPVR